MELGWEDATENAITLVEWPERADDALKSERLHVEIEFAPGTAGRGRIVSLGGSGGFTQRLRRLRAFQGLVEAAAGTAPCALPCPATRR